VSDLTNAPIAPIGIRCPGCPATFEISIPRNLAESTGGISPAHPMFAGLRQHLATTGHAGSLNGVVSIDQLIEAFLATAAGQ